eukprot:CAMPEP_0185024702 /NCGR_PEP_ID=MMETSP1103-20130426/7885_1 /TAXON_ID=36769 /ORGANISM="Paraphysomonas bandaiensis, Strain Caron Lab Isolate" /LENGTH=238 /DNA_ID=CAMNT_0027557739 /DNA_START=49 /DNA_END=765 /DNA_ORIENTATION=-
MFVRKAVHYFGRALRESGQALDRVALRLAENEVFNESFVRHRNQMPMQKKYPLVALDAFVAPNATLIGDVTLMTQSSVWFGAVIRGDKNKVRIGSFTNVQDKVVINSTQELETGLPADVNIRHHCTIGQGAVLNSCVIEDHCVIGMNAVISEGCVVESGSMIAAGSVLLPHTIVPPGELWAGNPAVYIRDIKEEEFVSFEKQAKSFASLGNSHRDEYLPFGNAYRDAEKRGIIPDPHA